MSGRLLTLDDRRRAFEQRRAEENAEADQVWRRRLRRLVAACCGWYLLGTVLTWSSLGAVGQERGDILLWLGLTVGNAGALLSCMFFAVAATERGDL